MLPVLETTDVPNLRKENRDLINLIELIKRDLLMRGEKEEDGIVTVNLSNGIWHRINDMLANAEPESKGQPDPIGKIPKHHKQWFEQLKKACLAGDLALMACLDIKTLEQRSVLTLVGHQNDEFVLTPVGHLCTADNPYEAYMPPRTEEQETIR